MRIDHIIKELEQVPGFIAEEREQGWLAKHEDGMIAHREESTIGAWFMFYPTKEEAVRQYFNAIKADGATILVRCDGIGYAEYKYNGNGFDIVPKEETK